MCSDSDSTSTSGSRSRIAKSGNKGSDHLVGKRRISMEVILETRVDMPKEVAESSLSAKARYKWVAAKVRT